jgi:hypothetical protein
MRRGSLILALAILLGLGLVQVAGAAYVKKGWVSGIAIPCEGLPGLHLPVAHLYVYKGTVLVAAKQFPTGTKFRFVLPPGKYLISNDPPEGGTTVTVWAARTTFAFVPGRCS